MSPRPLNGASEHTTSTHVPAQDLHTPQASRFVWSLPLLLFVLCTPLWLGVWEPSLFLSLNALFEPVHATFWAGLSLLGNAWGVLGVTAPLLVWAPRQMWAWLCAAPFAIVFARVGKALIESPRPAAVIDNAQMRIVGEKLELVSMPSGHTLTAFAVASAIYFSLPSDRRWRHGWLFVLAAGTGLSRIAVGAHWPADVAVGACLGLLAGLLGNRLLSRMHARHLQPRAWSLRAVALLVTAAAYPLATEGLDFAEALAVQYVLVGVIGLALVAFVRKNLQHHSLTGHG
ncbi:MAG: phosphatase PAP2 family protein [Rhodoferax sp.]|nr:phosphatase PAP2 family protein [Rhodoferax sp.]